jgi:hypothetical protein
MQDTSTLFQAREAAKVAALGGSEDTLNEQLRCDSTGKRRDEVLDELAVAAQEIEFALAGGVSEPHEKVLRDLLDAIRLGESIVTQTWDWAHG